MTKIEFYVGGERIGTLQGMRVIESVYLEQDGEPYTVRRTWPERLLTLPWRPFVTTRIIVPRIPNPGAFRLNATTLVIHPVTLRRLSQQLALPVVEREQP